MPVSPLITARRRPRERTAVRTRQAAVGHVRVRQTGALGEPGHQVALGRAAGDAGSARVTRRRGAGRPHRAPGTRPAGGAAADRPDRRRCRTPAAALALLRVPGRAVGPGRVRVAASGGAEQGAAGGWAGRCRAGRRRCRGRAGPVEGARDGPAGEGGGGQQPVHGPRGLRDRRESGAGGRHESVPGWARRRARSAGTPARRSPSPRARRTRRRVVRAAPSGPGPSCRQPAARPRHPPPQTRPSGAAGPGRAGPGGNDPVRYRPAPRTSRPARAAPLCPGR